MSIKDEIIEEINSFKTSIEEAAYLSKAYCDQYKLYCSYKMRDSDLLKERIKDKVAETVNSDEWLQVEEVVSDENS